MIGMCIYSISYIDSLVQSNTKDIVTLSLYLYTPPIYIHTYAPPLYIYSCTTQYIQVRLLLFLRSDTKVGIYRVHTVCRKVELC